MLHWNEHPVRDDRITLYLQGVRPAEHIGINFYTGSLDMWGNGEFWGYERQFIVKRGLLYFAKPKRICECCGTVFEEQHLVVRDYTGGVVCHARLPNRKVVTYELMFEAGKLTAWKYDEDDCPHPLAWERED